MPCQVRKAGQALPGPEEAKSFRPKGCPLSREQLPYFQNTEPPFPL